MEATKQVIFKLEGQEYGFDILLVDAIEPYTSVVSVPNTPAYILGILDLRGDVVPIFSLRIKFGLPETDAQNSQLIVTKSGDIKIGFKVDSVHDIESIDAKDLHELPSIVRSNRTRYAKAVANVKGNMVVLLDQDRMLDEEEVETINKLLEEQP